VGQASVVLGQPDFVTTTINDTPTQNSLRNPQGVASDGVHLIVADTDDNRVLIWNTIPTTNNQNADVVIGQPNFTTNALPGNTPNANSMRGPEGVWIQNGKLFVADTQNNRVLIFNHIPTTNGVAADLVLGAPNFTTYVNPDITQQLTGATASTMLAPVSVTSDGTRLFVTDLGFNRVLIFNSIPATNGAPADVALGQPDLVSSVANNAYTGSAATSSTDTAEKEVPVQCTVSNGIDLYNNPTYPAFCSSTMSFPRYALNAGGKLVVADGGNDRLLVWDKTPPTTGSTPDIVIGQINGEVDEPDGIRGLLAHSHSLGLGWRQPLRQRHLQPASTRLYHRVPRHRIRRDTQCGKPGHNRDRDVYGCRVHPGRRRHHPHYKHVHLFLYGAEHGHSANHNAPPW
jgi:hypothetical protein